MKTEVLIKQMADGDELNVRPMALKGTDLLERGGLAGRVFYDESSKSFYAQNAAGDWCGRDRMTFVSFLKHMGFCPVARNEASERISEVEHVMAHISYNCSVTYAGPVAGWKKGLSENNGQRILVTREPRLITPEPGEFPVLSKLIDNMFGPGDDEQPNDGDDQRPYILGWWKHAIECLENKYADNRGLCMVFAGEAGCGKTLLKDLISLSMGGRECKPYRFMIGSENFNGEFIGSEMWVIDDEQASVKMSDRSEFGANIKKAVADRLYRIRGMMRDGVVIAMFRRLLVCVNREPERLQVLPQLDDDIADKISVLLAHRHPMPMPADTPAERTAFWNTLTAELPRFLHWLLHEYTIDPAYHGRFGILHFHHPDLCSDLFEVSRERELWGMIERVLRTEVFNAKDWTTWYWCGTAGTLRELMASENSPLTRNEINSLPWQSTMGKSIKKISAVHPDRIIKKKVAGCERWFITDPNHSPIEAVEFERAKYNRGKAGDRKVGKK